MQPSNISTGPAKLRKSNVTGLSIGEENRLRNSLRLKAPSEPWVEVQFVEVAQTNPRGETIVRRLHDPSAFPPGGSRTGMIRCKICGIFTPPIAMEDGACLDHRETSDWGESPSARAIRAIQYYDCRELTIELAPESEGGLRREIGEQRGNSSESHPHRR